MRLGLRLLRGREGIRGEVETHGRHRLLLCLLVDGAGRFHGQVATGILHHNVIEFSNEKLNSRRMENIYTIMLPSSVEIKT